MEKKLELSQLKNYLGTGLKIELLNDCHDEYLEFEDNDAFETAFSKGSLWEFVGWSDISIPLGEGEFDGVLLKHESGFYTSDYGNFKPQFFKLSNLDKFIPELGFVPLEELKILELGTLPRSLDWKWLYYHQFEQLCKWHFWVFDQSFFEEGLIIDKLKP